MDPAKAIRASIDLVPSWYLADAGTNAYDITVNSATVTFYSLRRLTPSLVDLLQWIRTELKDLLQSVEPFPDAVGVDLRQEYFAERWLRRAAPEVQWKKLFDYARGLSHRTYENAEIGFNFIIRCDAIGAVDITDGAVQKIIDPLCNTRWTYFELDTQLRLSGYDEVIWADIADKTEYKFHPEFLHPYFTALRDGDWSAHKTPRGDLVVMNRGGLAAARWKGRWKFYDSATLKNSIVDIVGDYRVGANLFEIVFDLSFRRHGALLVYDPGNVMMPHIVNQESIIASSGVPDVARQMLARTVGGIRMAAPGRGDRNKGIFLEVATLDGAVVFNDDRVLAFGAMIETHPGVGSQTGARSTAATSAFLFGARPVKVSSDGEITFLFRSAGSNARLEFL